MDAGLSVGLEFNAVVGFKKKQSRGKILALNSVVEAIQSAERRVRLYLPKSLRSTPDYTLWNIAPYFTISKVTSGSGTSMRAPSTRNTVQVNTPIFSSNSSDWEGELHVVLNRLRDYLTGKGFLWMANTSTGLPVVVGSIQGANTSTLFTLEQVRRIAKLVVKYEGVIDELYEEYGYLNKHNTRSNRHIPLLGPLSLSQAFVLLDRCRTIEDIIGVVNYTGEDVAGYGDGADSGIFKANFTSLSTYGTIEVHQHAATVDPWAAIRWVNAVLAVVSFALRATDERIAELGESRQVFDEVISGAL